MPYGRPHNPWSVPSTKVRQFDGIGGPAVQVLKRYDDRGGDISSSISNAVEDVSLGEKGSMMLRPGMRRAGTETGYSVNWVGEINVGGIPRYGVIYNGGLALLPRDPRLGYEELEWPEEEEPDRPPDLPPEDPWFPPQDEYPPVEPWQPPEDQACEIGYTLTASPATAAFTIPYGVEDSDPELIYWYVKLEGYRPSSEGTLYIRIESNASWLGVGIGSANQFQTARCNYVTIWQDRLRINAQNEEDEWLEIGTYEGKAQLFASDGSTGACDVTLTVTPPAITITPDAYSDSVNLYSSEDLTEDFSLLSANEATLRWVFDGFTGDADLIAIMELAGGSGTLPGGESVTLTLTVSSPGTALEAGTYTAIAHFKDEVAEDVTATVEISIEVVRVPPEIELTPSSSSYEVLEGDMTDKTQNITIENIGATGGILFWEFDTITGDAELAGLISLNKTSGTLASGASEVIVLTVADPGSIPAGSYAADVVFKDAYDESITASYAVSLTVVASVPSACPYTGPVTVTLTAGMTEEKPAQRTDTVTVTGTQTGNNCRWDMTAVSVSSIFIGRLALERLDAAPSGNVYPSAIPWSTVLAGVSFPAWVFHGLVYNSGAAAYYTQLIAVKEAGATPAGSSAGSDLEVYTTKAPFVGASGYTVSVTIP